MGIGALRRHRHQNDPEPVDTRSHEMNVRELRDHLPMILSFVLLAAIRRGEEAHPDHDGGRTSALEEIDRHHGRLEGLVEEADDAGSLEELVALKLPDGFSLQEEVDGEDVAMTLLREGEPQANVLSHAAAFELAGGILRDEASQVPDEGEKGDEGQEPDESEKGDGDEGDGDESADDGGSEDDDDDEDGSEPPADSSQEETPPEDEEG